MKPFRPPMKKRPIEDPIQRSTTTGLDYQPKKHRVDENAKAEFDASAGGRKTLDKIYRASTVHPKQEDKENEVLPDAYYTVLWY